MVKTTNITIIGCGGVGSWIAYFLALASKDSHFSSINNLTLIDYDTLEDNNLTRLPTTHTDRNTKKVTYLSKTIYDTKPAFTINVMSSALSSDNISVLLNDTTHVFCATDTVDIQRLVRTYCQDNRIKYQRAGYDGDWITITRGIPITFDPQQEHQEGTDYSDKPKVYQAALAGLLAVYSMFEIEVSISAPMSTLTAFNSSLIPKTILNKIKDDVKDEILDDGDYHGSDDCNHEDCWVFDDAIDSYLDNIDIDSLPSRVQDVVDKYIERMDKHDVPQNLIDDIIEDFKDEMTEDDIPNELIRELKINFTTSED